MSIVKVNWSGGKDSTCSVLLHLLRGDYVKAVCYIPMFTKKIPLITKNHYEFILKNSERLRKMGAEVFIVSGLTYLDYVLHVSKKGKNKGKILGFPCFIKGRCGFKRDSKIKSLNSVDVGYIDYEDIGIAYDEFDRYSQLNDLKRSILIEEKITENLAFSFVSSFDMLSPIYDSLTRDGCSLCPHASSLERSIWFSDYPEAYDLLLDLQEIVKQERPDIFPLRNYKFFIDIYQIDLFGNYFIN